MPLLSALSEFRDLLFSAQQAKMVSREPIGRPNLVASFIPSSELKIKIMSFSRRRNFLPFSLLFVRCHCRARLRRKKKHENLIMKNVFVLFFFFVLAEDMKCQWNVFLGFRFALDLTMNQKFGHTMKCNDLLSFRE